MPWCCVRLKQVIFKPCSNFQIFKFYIIKLWISYKNTIVSPVILWLGAYLGHFGNYAMDVYSRIPIGNCVLFNVEEDWDKCVNADDGSLSLQLGVKVYYGNGMGKSRTVVATKGDHEAVATPETDACTAMKMFAKGQEEKVLERVGSLLGDEETSDVTISVVNGESKEIRKFHCHCRILSGKLLNACFKDIAVINCNWCVIASSQRCFPSNVWEQELHRESNERGKDFGRVCGGRGPVPWVPLHRTTQGQEKGRKR